MAFNPCGRTIGTQLGQIRSIVALVVMLCCLALVGGACDRNFVPLEVGQCLPDNSGIEGRRAQKPTIVACSSPHRYQVFAVEKLQPPNDKWPGEDVVSANAEQVCVLAIRAATGLEPQDTPDEVQLFHVDPTEGSWRGGDRDVECLFRWDTLTMDTLVKSTG